MSRGAARVSWGDGAELITLASSDLTLSVLTHGATVQSLRLNDGTDVVLGYDDLAGYLADTSFHGATVGRFANRIAGGTFEIDGASYTVPANDGHHALHGGPDGFGTRDWTCTGCGDDWVELALVSPDGDMGFPGRLEVTVRFEVARDVVTLTTTATTDAPTVVNLTNHAYFNLHGTTARTVADHVVTIAADAYLPVDDTAIPLPHAPQPVRGPFDLRTATALGDEFRYDHTFVLDPEPELHPAAVVEAAGRRLTVRTTEPGVQLYSGNFLTGQPGKVGEPMRRRTGLCLETQHFPDSPNRPDFPSTVLRPGEPFRSVTEWRLESVTVTP